MPRRNSQGLPRRWPRSWRAVDDGLGRRLARLRARAADEAGITIMELIVTMAVMVLVISALSTVAAEASKSEVRTNRTFQAQVEGRKALDKLRRELHCANAVSVVNSSGTAVAAGTSGNGIRVALGGYCPTAGLGQSSTTPVYVTWCTLTSTLKSGTYGLYRLASTSSYQSCANSGVKWADYLTTATPFCLPNTTTACGGVLLYANSLPTLHVTIPVNLNGATSTSALFKLIDDIALRNAVRS